MITPEDPQVAFNNWLAERDLHVRDDIQSDCDCARSNCEHTYPVFWLRMEHDPPVGIFGADVSPMFRHLDDLIKYWHGNKALIEQTVATFEDGDPS